jgi:hypothetical protein
VSEVGRVAGLDKRALVASLIVATAAFVALAFLVDRLERLALARPIGTERRWSAPAGSELRLGGLAPGALLAVETSAGDGLTVQAEGASFAGGRTARRLLWMSGGGDAGDDNKAALQVSILAAAPDGEVVLSRSGTVTTPQLRIETHGVTLQAEAGVTIGDALFMPVTSVVADGRPIEPEGPVFPFTIAPGGTLSVEFPAFPDGRPDGLNTWIGPVRESRQDTQLPVAEVAIVREGAEAADRAACGAPAGTYAVAPVLRLALAPFPQGSDCRSGQLRATALTIGQDSVALDLAGSAYVTTGGQPSASIWSWALSNPVLEIGINKALPLAISGIFGLIAFRRRAAAEERKAAGKAGKPRPKKARPR